MKFTLSWLKEHLDTEATLVEVRDTLTMLGLEVEGITNPAETLKGFIVGYVVEAVQHPNADRLRVCKVDTGGGTIVQVVCGAPNARTGMKGVFAPTGSYIPGTGITLKASKIRGEESNGMLCSSRELQLGDDHSGIIDLPAETVTGQPAAEALGLDDAVIEIKVTPNRGDCLGAADRVDLFHSDQRTDRENRAVDLSVSTRRTEYADLGNSGCARRRQRAAGQRQKLAARAAATTR